MLALIVSVCTSSRRSGASPPSEVNDSNGIGFSVSTKVTM